MSLVRLGLCCSRAEGFRWDAQSSLRNAVQFLQISQDDEEEGDGGLLSLSPLDGSAEDLEESLLEATDQGLTHLFFLSPGALLPFYSLQRLIDLRVPAVGGISWTWRPGASGEDPEIFPRIGYFDGEGRPYPYFGWSAPDIFEVDWCGLDCLLLERDAIERIIEPLRILRGRDPALRISLALRSLGIPIRVDSFVQCPQVITLPSGARKLIPSPGAWLEFSRDCSARRLPRGSVFDPSYRGRVWYRDWVKRCLTERTRSDTELLPADPVI